MYFELNTCPTVYQISSSRGGSGPETAALNQETIVCLCMQGAIMSLLIHPKNKKSKKYLFILKRNGTLVFYSQERLFFCVDGCL